MNKYTNLFKFECLIAISAIIFFLTKVSTLHAENLLDKLGATCIAHFDKTISVDWPMSALLEQHGGRIVPDGISGGALQLIKKEYLVLNSHYLINPSEGTLMFWVRPHWGYFESKNGRLLSHTFTSFKWLDSRNGYFVLSDGWWEPAGSSKTYLVLNNYDKHVKCDLSYVEGEWIHFACSWKLGGDMSLFRLYINGSLVYDSKPFRNQRYSPASIFFLGCDKGTTEGKQRWADSDFDELIAFSTVLSDNDIQSIIQRQDPNKRRYGRMDAVSTKFYQPFRNVDVKILETRALFDGGTDWVSELGANQVIKTIKKVGFNVYMPLVWHGRGTRYPSGHASQEDGLDLSGEDPLARLIKIAHENGIQVHPWVMIAKRWKKYPEFLKGYYDPGTPAGAFDLHKPGFRKFIIRLILDIVQRYDIDGINLDYIRTGGICTSQNCINDYRQSFGRDLLRDIAVKNSDGGLEVHVQQWQDGVVKAIVREISVKGKKIKPKLSVSVDGCPIPIGFPPNDQGRQEIKWANAGWVDIIFNMEYSTIPNFDRHELVSQELHEPRKLIMLLANWEKDSDGNIKPRDAELVSKHVNYVQKRWPGGVGIYRYKELSTNEAQIKALQVLFKDPYNTKQKR